jgi:DNA topoisomerase-1
MTLKRGRFGSFWACTGYPECKNTKPTGERKATGPAPASSAAASAGAPAGASAATPAAPPKPAAEPLPDEPVCEKCGRPMVRRQGRFGPFVACSGYPECKNIRGKKAAGGPRKKAEPKAKAKKKE